MNMFRTWMRGQLLHLFNRVLESDEGRRSLLNVLRGSLDWRTESTALAYLKESPYAELCGQSSMDETVADRSPVFVTARFRSGSTLLWNIFRQCRGFTSYYEPLNERRWFDPDVRGQRIDESHRGVSDYWREYQGLTQLGRWYRQEWTNRRLFMDAGAWDPDLREYIAQLVDYAADRAALQFNRVDFRLPWLRSQFPAARIVHLYRHPRDQWLSTFLRTEPFPKNGSIDAYWRQDNFYLRAWARDLSEQFPFLDENLVDHPYQLSYYLWRLSYAYGRAGADVSIAFENLVTRPRETLEVLFARLDVPADDIERGLAVIETPRLRRWCDYAPDEWFAVHEAKCDRVLAQFAAGSSSNPTPLSPRQESPFVALGQGGYAE